MNCQWCDNCGFIPSEAWEEWSRKFVQARERGASISVALRAAGDRPECPEEELCAHCHGASASISNATEALRHLAALGVSSPEVSVSVSQDFMGRRKVVAQVWDGRDWIRASTLAEAVGIVRNAVHGDQSSALAEADVAVEELAAVAV